jgi:exo-beta-1,3-glucanase (GH17 family)
MNLAVLSCNMEKFNSNSKISPPISMEKIKHMLDTGILIERQTPFILRKFDPYLDGKWIGNAISYGCYRKGQAPGVKGPSEIEILEDLNIIKNHWNLIRMYGSDEDAERVLKVIKENNLPIKVMLGVWLENETKHPQRKVENIYQVLKAIQLGNDYVDLLAAINVGNESRVFWSWHQMEQKSLIKYIRMVRNNTTVPVTTADDYNFWNKAESNEVADEIDFIVAHIYALWNGKTLDNAIEWMDAIYFQDIKTMHADKEITIGETGWATNYNPNKTGPGEQGTLIKGKVSVDAQGKYLIQLYNWLIKNQITTFLFEAFDEPWKGGGENSGPNEVEKHWGVYYENRQPKASFQYYLNQIEKQ